MSLLDSLLLEGYRDPRDIYIALRADGQKGSGTASDPYDGGTRPAAPFQGSLTFNRNEFVVQAPNGLRGLSAGGGITIMHVHGPAATWFNQAFTVADILETQVVGGVAWPRIFTVIGSSTPPAPPDVQFNWNNPLGSRISLRYTDSTTLQDVSVEITINWPVAKVVCAQDQGLVAFDAVTINNISDASFAGTFPILGAHGPNNSFRYRLTCSTLPSDVTTPLSCTVTKQIHRFDEVMRNVSPYSVIHLGPGSFETRGFSSPYAVDPDTGTALYVGYIFWPGFRLLGSGIDVSVLKLVYPVDEINQTSAVSSFISTGTSYAEVADLTVDCNVLNHATPYGIFPAPVTCGGIRLLGSFIRVHRVRVINFCVQARAECFGILLIGGDFNVIEDCILEKPGENNTHETTLLGNVGEAVSASARSPIVRHNYVNCAYSGGVSSEVLRIQQITYETPDTGKAVVKTYRPHHRTANNNVRLNNVLKNTGLDQDNHEILAHCFDDTFPITDWVSETEFKIKKSADAPGDAQNLRYVDASGGIRAAIGIDFHAPAAGAGTGCVTEGNSAFDCRNSSYNDTGSTRDGVVRDNYYSNTHRGVWHDLSSPDVLKDGDTLTLLTGSPPTAQYKTKVSHLLSRGQAVQISNAAPEANYSGVFVVKDRIDDLTFTYEPHTSPDGTVPPPALSSNPGQYAARWQTNHFVVESNLYDLYANDGYSASGPTGIVTQGNGQINPYLFPQVIIRENIIRSIDNAPDTGGFLLHTRGMFLESVENALVDQNIITAVEIYPIAYLASQNIRTFNNRTPQGDLIRSQLFFGETISDDLAARIEDALVMLL